MTAPHPNPPRVGEGIFEYTFPCLGKVRMGDVPQGFYFQCVILNSGAERSVIQNPLQPPPMRHTGWIFGRAMCERMRTKPVRWRKTMSFPTTRIIQICAGTPYEFSIIVTPASEPESPSSIEGFKIHSVLCNSPNYEFLNQVHGDRRLLPKVR